MNVAVNRFALLSVTAAAAAILAPDDVTADDVTRVQFTDDDIPGQYP